MLSLNDREIALLVWVGLLALGLLIWTIRDRSLRMQVGGLIKTAVHPRLAAAFLATLGAVAAATWLLALAGVWTPVLLKDALVFGIAVALPLAFRQSVFKGSATFAGLLAVLLGPAAAVELLTNLATFPLLVELVLVPVVAFIAMVGAYRKAKLGKRGAEVFLVVVGLAFLTWSVATFVPSATAADWTLVARTAAYLALLSLMFAVYVIVFGIVVVFTDKFHTINFREGDMRHRLRAKLALVRVFAGHAGDLARLAPIDIWSIAEQRTFADATRVASQARQRRYDQEEADRAASNRLAEFAGIHGTDDEGRQLDQREFVETRRALLWLQTCMMGWYQRRGAFEADVLDIAGPYTQQGLPDSHGINLTISRDKQAWFAWRRTIGGWVFAIGQSSPKDDWRFDGPQPPSATPGDGNEWGSFGGTNAPNW